MTKFQHLLCLLCSAMFASTAYSHEFPDMAAGMNDTMSASENANKAAPESPGAETQGTENSNNANDNPAGVQLDRSGIGRASVHLQILQQSNQHFNNETGGSKKPAEDKRNTAKPAPNN